MCRFLIIFSSFKFKGKEYKVNRRTCHEDPEGERTYSAISLTSVLRRGGWSSPRPGRFTPGKETRHPPYKSAFFKFYRCTVHSDIHTVHSPTDAHLLKLRLNLH